MSGGGVNAGRAHVGVFFNPKRDHPRRRPPGDLAAPVAVGVHHGCAARRQGFDEASFFNRHALDVAQALEVLAFTPTRGASFISKVLRSAVANAGLDADAEDLYVAEAQVDSGPTRRGILPRARGRMDRIHHRTSHITVVLSDERPTEEEA